MNAAKIKKANEIFQLAVELPVEELESFLTTHCAGDTDLRAFVEQLLSHDAAGMGEFMCRPVFTPTPEGTQDPERNVPKRVGRYAIIRKIGEGGMGVVYEARQDHPARSVALKLLRPGLASGDLLRRFQYEAEVLGQLQHPGIACIYEAGVVEQQTQTGIAVRQPFFAMELIRGQALDRYVKQNNISMRGRLELLAKTCEAVQHAHQKGVIHRDLKPGNILIDESGSPKILDFGVARATNADIRATMLQTDVGQLIGTVAYMSPEQVAGDPQQLDTRSDVYALGVILYELLTGTHPYPVKGEMYEVVKHIAETEPKLPSKVWSPVKQIAEFFACLQRLLASGYRLRVLPLKPGARSPEPFGPCPIDNELQTIVLKALSKNRERRYQSAEALRQDIIRYLAGEPIEAKRDSSLYVLKKSLRRHRVRITVTVGFMAVAALALYVGSRTGTREAPALALTRPISSLAVLPLVNLSGDPDQDYFSDGITGELITALGKIKALKVISRMSVMAYKDTDKSPPEIARELKVDALVAGTVALLGDRVRIAVNLIKGDTSEQLWGDSYERDMRDIWAVQSEIALAIANRIEIQIAPQQAQRLANIRSADPDAYNAYLRGLDYIGRPDYLVEDYRLAIQMFERAVSLDPSFVLAYAELSMAHAHMHHYGYDRTEARAAQAKSAVDRALELQTELPEAHLAMGYYHYWCYREYDLALEALAIAERDLPNDARILSLGGAIRRRQGRIEESLGYFKRSFELSPLDAAGASEIGATYILLRRYLDGVRWFDRSISLAPNQVAAYYYKAWNYWLWRGHIEQARAALEDMPRKHSPYTIFAWFQQELIERNYQTALDRLASTPGESIEYMYWFIPKSQLAGLVYHLMGESERSREAYDTARILLEEEIKERADHHRVRSSLGIVYAGLGRKEDAIREGKLGVELFPVSKDALIGPYGVEDLAFIYTLVGERDDALDQIEYLLSIPSLTMSVPMLRLDPRWDPLRDHPRYKDLLQRMGLPPARAYDQSPS